MTDTTTHRVRVLLDTSDAARGRAQLERELSAVSSAADKAGQRVSLIGRAFGGLGTNIIQTTQALSGFTAGMAALGSLRVLAGFDDQMATVQSVLLASEKDFNRLREAALDFGTTTRFGAQEAAEGLELLARAGAGVDGSLNLLGTTLKLAQAENLSLGEASENLVKITRGMRLELTEAARVADVLSATASASTTSVRDLTTAFRYAAAISSGFKTPIEEVAAALGVLADNGQDASIGGTAVRGFLSRIAAPTKEFVKDLSAIGLTIQDINPETNTLIEILEKLAAANITTSKAFDLFKQRAGAGAEILVNNIDRVKEFKAGLEAARGSLEQKFEVKADTLINDLKLALGAIQNLIITLGDAGLTGAIRFVARTFATAVNTISTTIDLLVPVLKNIAIGIAVAFSPIVLAAFTAGIIQTLALMPLLIARIFQAAAAMAVLAAANPFTAIGVAIGLVITLVQQFGDQIGVIGAKYATLSDLFQVLGDDLVKLWSMISTSAMSAFEAVAGYAATAANFIGSAFETAINFVVEKLNGLLAMMNAVTNALRGVAGFDAVAPFQIGKTDLSITPPKFIQNILQEADDLALDRLAKEKEARAKLVDTLHSQAIAATSVSKAQGESAAATDLATGATKRQITESERMFNILEELNSPAIEAQRNINALNQLFAQGAISVSQYSDQLQRMREVMLSQDQTLSGGIARGLNKVAEGATRIGENVEKFITGAFSKASDAIANFVTTGKFDFKALISSILEDLVRLATNQLFGQLAQSLLGPSLGAGGGLGGLFGFATGGGFMVGGNGGTDSQAVAFRASPGERVRVETPQQQRRSDMGSGVQVNVINNSGGEVRQERRRDAGGREIVDVIVGEVNQRMAGGEFDNTLSARFGNRVQTKPR